jgi:anti-sigma B factor antagonist
LRDVVAGPVQFGVDETVCGGEHTLMLTGELDLASTPILQATVASLSRTVNGVRAIRLDLSGLQFIDSTGLHAILATAELCRANEYEFSLVPGPPNVQRLFEIVNLVEVLPWRPRSSDKDYLSTDSA